MYRNRNITNQVFDGCVRILDEAAEKLGLTYKEINVAVFVIIWPIVTLGLTCLALRRTK